MLIKTNEKDSRGKDLYFNKANGKTTTLTEATFSPSMRRTMRHMNDNNMPKLTNQGQQFIQRESTKDGKRKFIVHVTNKSLRSFNALYKLCYGVK